MARIENHTSTGKHSRHMIYPDRCQVMKAITSEDFEQAARYARVAQGVSPHEAGWPSMSFPSMGWDDGIRPQGPQNPGRMCEGALG